MATNEQIGQAIGLTYSGVSRIRSGNREPGRDAMVRIAAAFHWPVEQQIDALIGGRYAAEFSERAHATLDPVEA